MKRRHIWKMLLIWIVICSLVFLERSVIAKAQVANHQYGNLEERIYPTLPQEERDDFVADGNNQRIEEETLFNYLDATSSRVTVLSSSEFSTPQNWTMTLSNNLLKLTFYDENAVDESKIAISITNSSYTGSYSPVATAVIHNHRAVITYDLSNTATYPVGNYKVLIWENTGTEYVQLAMYYFKIDTSGACFVKGAYSDHETALLNQLNEEFDPNWYCGIPMRYFPYATISGEAGSWYVDNFSATQIDKIIQKAYEITSECALEEDKVRAIHDWVCLNFAYDYEAVLDGNTSATAAKVGWVFDNKRGVCSGIARMCQVMFTAVDIPCINLLGYASNNLLQGDDKKYMNHEWNAVYIDGSWHYLDITWDCMNEYYGKHVGENPAYQNVSGKGATYSYYGVNPFVFGNTHISYITTSTSYAGSTPENLDRYEYDFVTELSFAKEPTKKFQLGQEFFCDAKLQYKTKRGYVGNVFVEGKEYLLCTGYNPNVVGTQSITIQYCGKSLSYEIEMETACGDSHDYTGAKWIKEQFPSCEATGLQYRVCTACGTKEYQEIPQLGHEFSEDWTVDLEPSCTEDGMETKYCIRCMETQETRAIPMLGHVGGVATCVDFAVCERCNCEYGVLAEHTFSQETVRVEPTCETPGGMVFLCEVCGECSYHNISERALGHVVVAATCEEEAYCSRCGEIRGTALGHTGGEATCLMKALCMRCGCEYGNYGEHVPAVEWTTDKRATCEEAGMQSKHCTYCDESIEVQTIPVYGHIYGEWTTVKEASYEEEGLQKRTCTVCNKKEETKTLSKLVVDVGNVVTVGTNQYTVVMSQDDVLCVAYEGNFDDKVAATKTSITVPPSVKISGKVYKVTEIKDKAFANCKKLKKITIGNNIVRIGNRAFYNCTKLSQVTIPSSVKKIGKEAFLGCKNLKKITIKTTKLTKSTIGKNAFKKIPENAKVKVPNKKIREYKTLLVKKGLSKKSKISK